ncbi:MAG: hypothetical protein OXK82_12965 [Deltaproteobacteria bacterium]|nr:hypothetical protein [bacterium]MDE0344053.1 hypothetical protein [Deltaproteobacteria bacterium]
MGAGRPRKQTTDIAVPFSLPQWAFDMVDDHVRGHIEVAYPNADSPTARTLAQARTNFVAGLILDKLGLEASYPTTIKVLAPAVGKASALEEAGRWLKEVEAALNDAAPVAIKAAIEANRRMHELLNEQSAQAMEANRTVRRTANEMATEAKTELENQRRVLTALFKGARD